MRVKLAFWLAGHVQNIVLRLLSYGCRNSNPPMDLPTEMAKALNEITMPIYVLSPEQFADRPIVTKH